MMRARRHIAALRSEAMLPESVVTRDHVVRRRSVSQPPLYPGTLRSLPTWRSAEEKLRVEVEAPVSTVVRRAEAAGISWK